MRSKMGSMTRWLRRTCVLLLALTLLVSAASAAYTTLKYGDSGTAVTKLQTALTKLGYKTGGVDGKFGSATQSAVKAFQQANGLVVDGKAGDKTQTLLYKLTDGSGTTTKSPAASTASSSSKSLFGGDYTTLAYASRGTRVTTLQKALTTLGFGKLTADGKFGGATQDAVKAFQRKYGLTVDGKAGAKTLQKLESVYAAATATATPKPTATPTPKPTATPAPNIPSVTLRSGSTGADVKTVQTRLKALGWYTGTVDGKYGSGTLAAVKAFQKASGLSADGICGSATYKKLFSDSAKTKSGATPKPTATNSATYETLRKNSTGTAVSRLQGQLALLGYVTSTCGTYDNTTVAAVKSFQSKNGLTSDGIAGNETQRVLYSGNAVAGPKGKSTEGSMSGPSTSSVKLLHWQNEIKSGLGSKAKITIYDPATGLGWKLQVLSKGRHCDVEPATASDTAIQYRAFGNQEDWGPKTVYAQLPDGRWSMAVLSNVAHGTGAISNNNFDGQNCLHFLRDMAEAQANDPVWGVKCQEVLRASWKALTGQTVN